MKCGEKDVSADPHSDSRTVAAWARRGEVTGGDYAMRIGERIAYKMAAGRQLDADLRSSEGTLRQRLLTDLRFFRTHGQRLRADSRRSEWEKEERERESRSRESVRGQKCCSTLRRYPFIAENSATVATVPVVGTETVVTVTVISFF
ncbi:hypothetical protein LR48_Vigan323s000200 [Vigna angularis]|uniref:Uncharacterized protein n=1 Tax=Phaseolus angularis TaxID=3914 RepID=A0A0L9T8B9_PHAAN|nr:hypothetical protein LR48_Vigan323s000200 [Vigna angularis]